MFHQVLVKATDQHAQQVLWRSDVNERPEIYVMQVMTFGASCSPSCAQYVKNLNAQKFLTNYPRAAYAIKTNHYVDDMLESVDTIKEAIQLAQDVKYIHKNGGFKIRNWVSNSKPVLKRGQRKYLVYVNRQFHILSSSKKN